MPNPLQRKIRQTVFDHLPLIGCSKFFGTTRKYEKSHFPVFATKLIFFCMTLTILIICFQLPTTKACLSFYPSLHTPNVQTQFYTNNDTNTFERKEKLFSRSRISNLELVVRHALHEPAPASKPLRPPFRQREIKLLPPSFAKKN